MEQRPEEKDLRVMATSMGIDRLSKAHGLTPFETTIAMKLALRKLLGENRAPMATIHQFRGLLRELEAEQAIEIPMPSADGEGVAA
jgi:hypothetical protein